MVQILMEGLIPVSEAAREFMQKRAAGREFYIRLDSAILIGHPAAISASLVLVPMAILLSIILPGNRVILFADLAVIPFLVALFAPLMKGNVVRMIIAGILELGVGFYIATGLAPVFTQAAQGAGFQMPERCPADYQHRRWFPVALLVLQHTHRAFGWGCRLACDCSASRGCLVLLHEEIKKLGIARLERLHNNQGSNKLDVVDVAYDLEYGSGVLETQTGRGGLLLIDDVLATGGTLGASVALSGVAGYTLHGIGVLLDIGLVPGFRCGGFEPRSALQYG